jgi:hypothetical protein
LLRTKLESKPIPLTKEDVVEFRAEVERLPAALRIGPQYILGLALEKFGTPTEASFAFLKVRFLLGGPPEMQADAVFRAAQSAERAGMDSDAKKLFRYLGQHFPASAAAAAAKKLGKI